MGDLLDEMAAAMRASMKTQRAQQKSEDIIDFIRSNWRFFCRSKGEMEEYVHSMGSNGVPYGVDSLCDMLGIPTNVFFKRSPVKDIGGAILDFRKSKLFELFTNCSLNMNSNSHLACLFVVAGKKSIVITNMQTTVPDQGMVCYTPSSSGYDIHIFKAEEAPLRLPNLFNHTEDNYE